MSNFKYNWEDSVDRADHLRQEAKESMSGTTFASEIEGKIEQLLPSIPPEKRWYALTMLKNLVEQFIHEEEKKFVAQFGNKEEKA